MALVKLVDELVEVTYHPFGRGKLTSDGVQYSAEVSGIGDDFTAIEAITIKNVLYQAQVWEIEFGLTGAVKSSSTLEGVTYKWQASDDGTNWEDLMDALTRAADASIYADVDCSGRPNLAGNFLCNKEEFQVRMVVKSAAAGGETAAGKAKSSSYVKILYRR